LLFNVILITVEIKIFSLTFKHNASIVRYADDGVMRSVYYAAVQQ